MIPGLAARLIPQRPSPTVDLYFRNACADWIAPDGPVWAMSGSVFETDEARLVIRHDTGAPRCRGKRLVYLLDDAVFAGCRDRTLPALYRAKLRLVECAAARRLLPQAGTVVTSTPEVSADLPSALVRGDAALVRIDPCWGEVFAPLDHFAAPGPTAVAFLGAATHASSLAFVIDVMQQAFRLNGDLTFHLSANHRAHVARTGLPVRLEAAIRWPDYRRSLVRTRRHIALYPLGDGPFARARSINKLIEHAIVGAAPLYARGWAVGDAAALAGAGLSMPPDAALWARTIASLAADRARARSLAEGAQRLARTLNRPGQQRETWAGLLGIRT